MFGIVEIDRHDYVRLDPAKVNSTPNSKIQPGSRLRESVRLRNCNRSTRTVTRCNRRSHGPHSRRGQSCTAATLNSVLTEIEQPA